MSGCVTSKTWYTTTLNRLLFNEVKVKLGSLFYQYFLTNNDLYNGAKIVNLPLVVVEI